MRLMQVRAVALDIGGVMVRIARTWAEAAAQAGVAVEGGDCVFSDFEEFEAYQVGDLPEDQYLWALAHRLGTDLQGAALVHRHILLEASPGSEELVEELEGLGIVCGCLSNTNALHWRILVEDGSYPALARLSVKVGSHVARTAKPEPEIYRLFERQAGACAGAVAYFDDVEEYVLGGKAMGWQVVRVVPGADPIGQVRSHLLNYGVPLRTA